MARTMVAILEAGHAGSITIDEGFGPAETFSVPAYDAPATPVDTGLETAIGLGTLVQTYYVTRSATTGKIRIYTSGAFPFTLTLSGAARSLLGFASSSYSGATTYTAERVAAYYVQALGIELSEPQVAQDVRSEAIRHGRVEATVFGRGRRWRATAYVRDTQLPATQAWLQSRLVLTPAADATALTESNLDGSISVAVLSATWETVQEGITRWTAQLIEVA